MFRGNGKCLHVISVAGSDAPEHGTGDKKGIFSFTLKSPQNTKRVLWAFFFFLCVCVIWKLKPFKLFPDESEKNEDDSGIQDPGTFDICLRSETKVHGHCSQWQSKLIFTCYQERRKS